MSEDVELLCTKPKSGFVWAYGGKHIARIHDLDFEVGVPLFSMFQRQKRFEKPTHEFDGEMFYRVVSQPVKPDRKRGWFRDEVVTLEPGLYRRFLQLPSLFKRSADEGERAIMAIASRYGLLQGFDPADNQQHFETAEYWLTKSREMAEATDRRERDTLAQRHHDAIETYIGQLKASVAKNTYKGRLRLSYRPNTLLGALWLQWVRDDIPYQGRCEVCAAPLIGRRGMRTCSDYCRKVKSLEKQQ